MTNNSKTQYLEDRIEYLTKEVGNKNRNTRDQITSGVLMLAAGLLIGYKVGVSL